MSRLILAKITVRKLPRFRLDENGESATELPHHYKDSVKNGLKDGERLQD